MTYLKFGVVVNIMIESIEEDLAKNHGRDTKKVQDQDYDESVSMQETYDDRGTGKKILDGVHDAVTNDYTEGTALVAGATAMLEKSGQLDVGMLNEVAAQYPEASAGALLAGAAVAAYEGADNFGVQAKAGEVTEYVQDALSGEEGEFVDLGELEEGEFEVEDRKVGVDVEQIDLDQVEELTEEIDDFEVYGDKSEVGTL